MHYCSRPNNKIAETERTPAKYKIGLKRTNDEYIGRSNDTSYEKLNHNLRHGDKMVCSRYQLLQAEWRRMVAARSPSRTSNNEIQLSDGICTQKLQLSVHFRQRKLFKIILKTKEKKYEEKE